MSFRITVDPGTVLTDLERITKGLETGAKEALDAGGKAGLQEAQNKVPVKTGFLKNSLYYQIVGTELELGGKAYYTAYVEFGHRAKTSYVPERPFIRPGAEIAMTTIKEHLASALKL